MHVHVDEAGVCENPAPATRAESELELDLPAEEERGLPAFVVVSGVEELPDDMRHDFQPVGTRGAWRRQEYGKVEKRESPYSAIRVSDG